MKGRIFRFTAIYFFLLSTPNLALAQQTPVIVPAGAQQGLHANLWFERYKGSDLPEFAPAAYLEPGTNYLLVLDLSTIGYADGRPATEGVLSFPVDEFEPGVISQVVVNGEDFQPHRPSFFYLNRHKAITIGRLSMRRDVEEFRTLEKRETGSTAFELLRVKEARPSWVLDRHVYRIGVRKQLGDAPLAIVFRNSRDGQLLRILSTRFCVGHDRNDCRGLPRESEEMEGVISGNPPPVPARREIMNTLPMVQLSMMSTGGFGVKKPWVWNSWIYRSGDIEKVPQAEMLLNRNGIATNYTLQVDASMFLYRLIHGGNGIGDTTADSSLTKLVQEKLAEGIEKLRFTIRAEAIGHAIQIVNRQTQQVEVNLKRLDPDNFNPDLTNTQNMAGLSSLAAATRIEIDLKPKRSGCGAVAISITDEAGIRPLDQLLHTVEVIESADDGRNCRNDGVSSVLTSGLRNLLSHGNAPPVDASLHIFEQFPQGVGRRSAAFLYGVGPETYSWEIEPPLSEYLGDPGNLEARVFRARKDTLNHVEHAYGRVATTLANALFSAPDQEEMEKATRARKALQDFVNNAQTPPTFLIRFTNRRGEVVIFPFGLLAASGAHAFVQKPLRTILPLPREDYSEPGCLSKWSLALSDNLSGSAVPLPDDIKRNRYWLGDDFENLRSYLTDQTPAQQEGLVVVAHHTRGRLNYHDNDFELQPNELTRKYGRATAAVLAMCQAGGVNDVDRNLLEKLNNFGLDAAIISPFSLDANYGKAFAIEFARVANKAENYRNEATLGELFDQAVTATAKAMRNGAIPGHDITVGDMGLELILVGNPDIKLCK